MRVMAEVHTKVKVKVKVKASSVAPQWAPSVRCFPMHSPASVGRRIDVPTSASWKYAAVIVEIRCASIDVME